MELSKQDKKAERLIIENRIIENGLQQEFTQGLAEIETILQTWKTKGMNNREAYHLIYQKITSCDKHTATSYDLMTGGSYFFNYGDAVKL
ncbi:hypothetical protein AHMF7605_19145 [Adhaeribacter arboris]|uniref:Uncharacterized protein n=1 Tax=Adhaeribacter arboris TaxID=2072846 RepID=A0A2T2YIZ0_9BACT|nr:hypothetical protein [Adhaeribacter arboris]PSR55471.1 hypothetical protein AHMF7605_19145 [Adhaeribacter arboris]